MITFAKKDIGYSPVTIFDYSAAINASTNNSFYILFTGFFIDSLKRLWTVYVKV